MHVLSTGDTGNLLTEALQLQNLLCNHFVTEYPYSGLSASLVYKARRKEPQRILYIVLVCQ